MAVAEAMGIQIASASRILKFYILREALLNQDPCASALLDAMEDIIRAEIAGSLRLAELCEIDPRLGYHSEAEVYKYFPGKLKWRAAELEKLLSGDIAEARKLLDSPDELAAFLYSDLEAPFRPGKLYETDKMRWSFEADCENLTFHLEFPGKYDCSERAYLYFMDYHASQCAIPIITIDKDDCEKDASGWRTDVTVPRSKVRYAKRFLIGIERAIFPENAPEEHHNHKPGNFCNDVRLAYTYFFADKLSPAEL